MIKLLSITSLILALVLFPPATLAVISNNAIPGDSTYPIKRGLEDIIFAVASLNPTTRAWFAAARSDRRFQEVTVLIAQGKKASDTLNELIEQTQIAANQIDQVSDPVQKAKLISQLSDSIAKYDAGLAQVSQSHQQPVSSGPGPSVVPVSISPQALPLPTRTTALQSSATPIPVTTPATSSTVLPTPLPTVQPTPSPNREGEERERQRQREIEEARKRLEEIKKKLEEERQWSQKQEKKQETKAETKERKEETKKEDLNLTPKKETGKSKTEKEKR